MGVIMGYIKDGITYMATDTRIFDDDRKRNEVCDCNYKLRKLDNGIIYGATNDTKIRQSLMANEEIFTLNKRGNLTVEHLTTEIVPKIYFIMKDADMLNNDKKDVPSIPSEILFGFKGKLFEMCSNFNVCRYEKYQSVGSLLDYSLNKISNINPKEDINKQIIKAIKCYEKNTEYVGSPYLTINTLDMEYELWEK